MIPKEILPDEHEQEFLAIVDGMFESLGVGLRLAAVDDEKHHTIGRGLGHFLFWMQPVLGPDITQWEENYKRMTSANDVEKESP